jgi:hypothetical protein
MYQSNRGGRAPGEAAPRNPQSKISGGKTLKP